MKLVLPMNLPLYLPVARMLAGKKAMVEEIEIREIEDVALIRVDKEEV